MVELGAAVGPANLLNVRHPPGYVDGEIELVEPVASFGEGFAVGAVVGEGGDGFEVSPEAEGGGDLVFLRGRGIAGGECDLTPGVEPGSDVADGHSMEAVAVVGRLIYAGDAVDEALNLLVTYRLAQNSYGHEG